MKGLEESIARALEALPGTWNHRCARGVFVLTESELRVFRLVGLGLTNGEIAGALFIDITTVRTHVKHIHGKCDIEGRARLAVVSYLIWARGLAAEPREKRREVMAEMGLRQGAAS